MIPSAKYPAKILLFGEYSILSGSEALAFPYPKYSGTLRYDCISGRATSNPQESQKPLIELFQYLSKHEESFAPEQPNINRLRNDLISDLYFDYDIPTNYGLGSSGAITAAVYDSYFNQTQQKSIDQVIKTLSAIESFYHLYSSGIDPLVSFTSQAIHVVNHTPGYTDSTLDWVRNNLSVYLIDSGKPGATKVSMESKTAKKPDQAYIELNNQIVRNIIRKKTDGLQTDIQSLCNKQFTLFSDLFTPETKVLA